MGLFKNRGKANAEDAKGNSPRSTQDPFAEQRQKFEARLKAGAPSMKDQAENAKKFAAKQQGKKTGQSGAPGNFQRERTRGGIDRD